MAPQLPQISLEQYAGIQAALADGHPLEAVLQQEGVPAWRWPDLDLEHTDAITKDPELFEQYCVKLTEAEDCLDRTVAPLADDLEAWTGFVAASSADDAIVEQHGLLPGDIKRLQRRWQKRFESDAKLGKQAEKLATDPPTPPDTLEVGPLQLRPFPWSPGAEEAKTSSALEPVAFLAATAAATPQAEHPPLPFTGSRPVPAGTLAIEPNPMLGQTAPISTGRKPRPATPFEGAPAPTFESVASTPQPAAPFVVPRPPRTKLEPVLALGQSAAPGAKRTHAKPSPSDEARGSTPEPPAPAAPLSFRTPAQRTPEQYGSFCAELDAAGPRRTDILERWGIDTEQRRQQLEQYWRQRFEAEPALRERFVAALEDVRE